MGGVLIDDKQFVAPFDEQKKAENFSRIAKIAVNGGWLRRNGEWGVGSGEWGRVCFV
ncbi:MAG: hypothetical protein LBI06_02100 [Treponema sp.]|jgi:hypothetical protein|nr:hypothetical protein [Treponema sp.]